MATEEKLTGKVMDLELDVSSEAGGAQSAKDILIGIAKGVLYALIGIALGNCGIPFGAYPFGVALLCATDRKVLYIFLGVCGSALIFSEQPILFVSTYSAVLLIRTLSRLALDPPRMFRGTAVFFSENLLLRMSTASLGGFILGLYALMSGGFLYYDLFGALILIIGAPVAVFIFYGIFNQSGVEGKLYYTASAVIAFLAVYGVSSLEVCGISVSAFLAMGVALYVVGKRGIVEGVAAAVICGLAYSPLYAPVFIFAALMYGALRRVSSVFAAMAAFTAGISWGIYVGGVGAISSLLSALLSSALIVGTLDKLFFGETKQQVLEEAEVLEEIPETPSAVCTVAHGQIAELRVEEMEKNLGNLQSAFSDLSRLFFDIGERMKKPLTADIRQICDRAFDACCGSCRNKGRCWEENYTETMAAINFMSAEMHRSGKLSPENIPDHLKHSCERIDDIMSEIQHNTARHMRELLLFDKSEIFALDYEAMAELIASGVRKEGREYEPDAELSGRLAAEMSAFCESVLSVAVYGKEQRRALVTLGCKEDYEKHSSELQKAVSEVLCGKVELVCAEALDGAYRCIYAPLVLYSVESACGSRRASDEDTYCGDTATIFSLGKEKLYSLISDGMGSGADAALSSRTCAVFMEKMLSVGSTCRTAMKMLNGFLRNKGGGSLHECSATLDLLELDLVRGAARFYKCGAAPTYVFRAGELFKLSTKTLPLGIIKDIDSKKLKFDVCDGDVIIMVSDGVTQGREECPWLYDLLRKTLEAESLERCVDLILDRAAHECNADDISVVAVKVSSVAR